MLKILLTSFISQFLKKKEHHFCAIFLNLQRLLFCKIQVSLSCDRLQKMLLK